MNARAIAWACVFAAACSGRSCRSRESVAVDDTHDAPAIDRARCDQEIAHAAVATPPGTGAIDALQPVCGADGTLAIWTTRGHTLSRLVRARGAGGAFRVPEVIATAVDALGPVANDGALGPLAWRSPTVAFEDALERDEWWAATLVPSPDGGTRAMRASVAMPAGAVALGILAPLGTSGGGVDVLGTIARRGVNPQLVRHRVRVPSDAIETLATDPPTLAEGELRAWDPERRVALASGYGPAGEAWLHAVELARDGGAAVVRGAVTVGRVNMLVASRGLAIDGTSVFAIAKFNRADRSREHCLALDPTMCVAPGAVTLVRVDSHGVTEIPIVERGLVDTFAADGAGTVLLMYLAGEGDEPLQHAVRVNIATRRVSTVALIAADSVPPLDHPALVNCDGEPWLAAEILVHEGGDGATRESAVMAIPARCLMAP